MLFLAPQKRRKQGLVVPYTDEAQSKKHFLNALYVCLSDEYVCTLPTVGVSTQREVQKRWLVQEVKMC